ncbi:hypothetical protein ACX0G9_15375 [Flavitalea flava]
MNLQTSILLGVLFSAMASCIPDKFCQPYLIDPVLIGFSTSEADTLILRRYKENDNFQHLIDTLTIVNSATNNGLGAGIYTTLHDTTIIDINISSPYSSIVSGYDWQLYIPEKNKTISFSNIVTAQSGGGKGCSQPIVSFEQDGQLIDAPVFFSTNEFYTSGYRAYIHP